MSQEANSTTERPRSLTDEDRAFLEELHRKLCDEIRADIRRSVEDLAILAEARADARRGAEEHRHQSVTDFLAREEEVRRGLAEIRAARAEANAAAEIHSNDRSATEK